VSELGAEVCLASDWEYDRELFALLEADLRRRGRSSYCVWPHNLEETVRRMEAGDLGFRYLVDRASNTSPEFLELHRLSALQGAGVLDSPAALAWASDKATMHLEFLSAGIPVPHTVILDPYQIRPELAVTPEMLAPLGSPFVIKPANTTGGGIGVRHAARSTAEVLDARRTHPRDKYLLQERIEPAERRGRRYWFRVFFACGEVLCAWWDDRTHVYEPLADGDLDKEGLQELPLLARRIAAVCALRLFSTEIAVDESDRFVVVDYVNESPDLRQGTLHPDGVPDALVARITCAVGEAVEAWLRACP
jgi:hypothetical protein